MPIRPENRARYPANWASEVVPRIAARAGGRCECRGECGRTRCHLGEDGRCMNRQGESAWLTGARVILTVAHRDHVPEHCADDNLAHWCQGCHLHYDREHHAETARRTRRDRKAAGDLFPNPPEEGAMHQEEASATSAPEPETTRLSGPAPSIGRVVWYWPYGQHDDRQPHAAMVAYVHGHECVNLAVFDENGNPGVGQTSVNLYHPDAVPEWAKGTRHATWMPYQVR